MRTREGNNDMARADFEKQIERARVHDVRSSRMADLAPRLEQVFIG